MATFALTNAFCYVAGHDFTGDSNQLSLAAEGQQLDRTTFRSAGWREFTIGLRSSMLNLSGFWQSATTDAVDPEAFAALGSTGRVVTIADVETEALTAYMVQSMEPSYQLFGPIGELAPYSVTGQGSDGVGIVRGQLAKAIGTASGTGQLGSILNLGAPTSTQFVYCTVHITTAGTTVTLQLQSDTAVGFSSPTTQATIGPLTTTGGTWMTRLAGPFAGETHWRLNVSAITGAFTIAAAIGVQ